MNQMNYICSMSRIAKFNWAGLQVGEPYLVEEYDRVRHQSIATSCRRWCARNRPDWKFITKRMEVPNSQYVDGKSDMVAVIRTA